MHIFLGRIVGKAIVAEQDAQGGKRGHGIGQFGIDPTLSSAAGLGEAGDQRRAFSAAVFWRIDQPGYAPSQLALLDRQSDIDAPAQQRAEQ